MRRHLRRALGVLVAVAALPLVLAGSNGLSAASAAIQLQLADLLFEQSDYRNALRIYERAIQCEDEALSIRARVGTVRTALRVAEFGIAAAQAETLRTSGPRTPEILALTGDSLWASGLFDEAETAYREALGIDPRFPAALRGTARSLASRNQLPAALDAALAALQAAPDDPDVHHTVGAIYERMRRYDEAASAYEGYANLLPAGDRGAGLTWVRGEVAFLRSFHGSVPLEITSAPDIREHRVPFKLVHDKVVMRGRMNGVDLDIALDTGAEQTVITQAVARRIGVTPLMQTFSAGVGMAGIRGLQVGKLDSLELGTLKVRNLPCLIKNPPIEMPVGEAEGFSPLALGLSVTVDYKRKVVIIGEASNPPAPDFELPLRVNRLATVRGLANGRPASFIVDTGGQAIPLSPTTARSLFKPLDRRRIGLEVYGASGVDPDAYLLPGVQLAFDAIRMPNQPVVVLNLRAPSVLLGYEIGGIVGHTFLKRYRVSIDMEKAVMRLNRG
jgi:predicted aspartyl protease